MIEKKAAGKEKNENKKEEKCCSLCEKVFWVRSREEKQRNRIMAAWLPQPA